MIFLILVYFLYSGILMYVGMYEFKKMFIKEKLPIFTVIIANTTLIGLIVFKLNDIMKEYSLWFCIF